MKIGHNDLFRFVSVRDPEPVYTVDPTKDVGDVEVVERLASLEVDLANPDPQIPSLLGGISVWMSGDIARSALAAAGSALDGGVITRLLELPVCRAWLAELMHCLLSRVESAKHLLAGAILPDEVVPSPRPGP